LSDLEPTPKKQSAKLRRTFAIANIAPLLHQHEPIQYEQSHPESRDDHGADEDDIYKSTDNEPTPKKRKKAPVREAINASRRENGPHKAENKVSELID
jgi:hypothetical protein